MHATRRGQTIVCVRHLLKLQHGATCRTTAQHFAPQTIVNQTAAANTSERLEQMRNRCIPPVGAVQHQPATTRTQVWRATTCIGEARAFSSFRAHSSTATRIGVWSSGSSMIRSLECRMAMMLSLVSCGGRVDACAHPHVHVHAHTTCARLRV